MAEPESGSATEPPAAANVPGSAAVVSDDAPSAPAPPPVGDKARAWRTVAVDIAPVAAGAVALWGALQASHPLLQILLSLIAVPCLAYAIYSYGHCLWRMRAAACLAILYLLVICSDQGIETFRAILNDYPVWLMLAGIVSFLFLVLYLESVLVALCLVALRDGQLVVVDRHQTAIIVIITMIPAVATLYALWGIMVWWGYLFCALFVLGEVWLVAPGFASDLVVTPGSGKDEDAAPDDVVSVVILGRTSTIKRSGWQEFGGVMMMIGVFTIAFPYLTRLSGLTNQWELYPAVFLTAVAIVVASLFVVLSLSRLPEGIVVAIVGVVIGLGALFSYLRINDNHVLAARVMPVADAHGVVPAGAAFGRWLAARGAGPGKPVTAVIVAAEGGDLRAAYTTALVLEAMRRGCPAFRRAHFATIGVSGGSVGAALSAAAPEDAGVRRDGCGVAVYGDARQPLAVRAAGTDLLRPALRGMVLWDLPTQAIPTVWRDARPALPKEFPAGLFADRDRTRFMATTLDRVWDGTQGAPELDRIGFADVWREGVVGKPALILLATDAVSGRRLAVSHLRFGAVAAPSAGDCLQPWRIDNADSQVRSRLLTLADVAPGRDVRLMDGAFASARFPGISPSALLPCPGRHWRVVDGGYFENSGLTTVQDLVDRIAADDGSPRRDVTVVVLAIANSRAPTNAGNTGDHRREPDQSTRAPYLAEAFSTLSALYQTRNARGEIPRTALIMQNRARYGPGCTSAKGICLTLRFEAVELDQCNIPIPLGWSLSKGALRNIREQLGLSQARPLDRCTGKIARKNRATMENVLRLALRGDRPGPGGGYHTLPACQAHATPCRAKNPA